MSAKSSRNKKRTPPRKGVPPAKGAGAAGTGRSAPGGQEASGPVTDGGPAPRAAAGTVPPLNAFRAPSLKPPSRTFPPPRKATAAPRVQPGTGAPAGAAQRVAPQTATPSVAKAPAPPSAAVPAPVAAPAGASAPSGRASVATAPPPSPARAPFLAGHMPDGPVQVMSWNCSQVEGMEPQGLGMTYWFDAAPSGDPYPVSVRFTGHRVSGDGEPGPKDTFETVRTIQRVVPGSGRVAMTTRVPGLPHGTWEVTATPVLLKGADGRPAQPPPPVPMPHGSSTGTTAFLPVVNVRAPGVRIGAWPALVSLGFLAAMILQWVLGVQRDLPVGRILVVSLIASLVGLVGAKVYYLATHRAEKANALTAGMSVQGFVIAAVSVLVLAGWVAGIPVGAMLDVSAPGLLLGMTIGRLGCFFGGCCAGLPTASRWGIWSSDRGVGVRRIPVQLLESAMAGTVAALTLVAVIVLDPPVGGLLFLAGLSAYTFGRQVLFPLRGIPRKTAQGRLVTMVVTGLVLVGSIVTLVAG